MGDVADCVAGAIVADDNVSRPELRCQQLLHISQEGGPVHRAIEKTGSAQAVMTQRHYQGRRVLVAIRDGTLVTLPACRASWNRGTASSGKPADPRRITKVMGPACCRAGIRMLT